MKTQRWGAFFTFTLIDQKMCSVSKRWLSCFADFGRDLSSARNQIVFHGLLFCNIFKKIFSIVYSMFKKGSVRRNVFQALSQLWTSLALNEEERERNALLWSFSKYVFSSSPAFFFHLFKWENYNCRDYISDMLRNVCTICYVSSNTSA